MISNLKNKKLMSASERGKAGAAALNGDPEKKRAASRKAAQTRLAENPNVFREMGSYRKKI